MVLRVVISLWVSLGKIRGNEASWSCWDFGAYVNQLENTPTFVLASSVGVMLFRRGGLQIGYWFISEVVFGYASSKNHLDFLVHSISALEVFRFGKLDCL